MKDIITNFAATINSPGGDNNLLESIKNIINAIIAVLGVVAVVIIIIGGIQYMTSSGDAPKVKKAKDTILYGVIGLIICALAFAIVNFVIFNLLGNGSSSPSSYTTASACQNAGHTWNDITSVCE